MANKSRRSQKRKQPKRPKSRRRAVKLVTTVGGRSAGGLSPCAMKYAKVLNDPFSGQTACVPTEFNFPTMKHYVRAYGTFQTGTAGVGFVSVNPFQCMFNGSGLSTPVGPVNWTSAAFAGATFATNAIDGVNIANTDTPYLANVSATTVQCRVVACGLRVRNVTPLLNRGGLLVGVEEPNHQDLGVNGYNTATVMNLDTATSLSATSSSWKSVVWHPMNPNEILFINGGATYTTVQNIYTMDDLGFIATAPTSTPQTYEWEVAACFEAMGTSVHGVSASESDPQGFALVQNATSKPEARKPFDGERFQQFARLLGSGLGLAKTAYDAYKGVSSTANQITNLAIRAPRGSRRIGPIIEEIE